LHFSDCFSTSMSPAGKREKIFSKRRASTLGGGLAEDWEEAVSAEAAAAAEGSGDLAAAQAGAAAQAVRGKIFL